MHRVLRVYSLSMRHSYFAMIHKIIIFWNEDQETFIEAAQFTFLKTICWLKFKHAIKSPIFNNVLRLII